MSPEETKQTENPSQSGTTNTASGPTGYDLLPVETQTLALINQQIANAKMIVYRLNAELESALKDVDKAEAQFIGALGFLATSKGMGGYAITPDLTRLTPPKG